MVDDQRTGGRGLGATGETVRANIRRLRGRMPVTELSARLEQVGRPIPPLGVRRIEAGERRVDTDDLMAFAVALDVSPGTLLMPHTAAADEKVAVTALADVCEAEQLWDWLTERHPRPGVRQFNMATWPTWVQERATDSMRFFADRTFDGDNQ